MLKETETEETIVFFVTFLSLVAFNWGGGGPWLTPGYAYGSKNLPEIYLIILCCQKFLFNLLYTATKTYRRRYLQCKEPKNPLNFPVLKFGILSQIK